MKLKNFPWLSEELLEVTCVDSADVFSESDEIRFFSDNGDWFVSQNEVTCRVTLSDQTALLETLGQRRETLWLLRKISSNALLLQFASFIERTPLDMSIRITEKQAEELTQKGEIQQAEVGLAVNWFTKEFLLTTHDQQVSRLAIAHFKNASQDQFLCIGNDWQANIQQQDGQLIVLRLTRQQKKRPAMSMLEGDIMFEDAGITAQLLSPVQRNLLDAALRNNGSYLELWQLYNKKQWSKALESASHLGALRFVKHEALDEEQLGWAFTPELPEKLEEFRNRWRNLEAQSVQVEVTTEAPQWSHDEDEGKGSDGNVFQGELVFKETLVVIYPDEKRRSDRPPEQGYIAYSLAGEAAVKRRREEAKKAIDSGNRLPQLSHLLQGVSVDINPYRPMKPMSSYAKDSFQGTPTERQVQAIGVALNTADIALIIGPPGTGKTQVIAALQRRLAEEHNTPNIQHQVLVSSFQHDAVDNALNRSDVYGLPAVKVGGRNNKEHDSQPIHQWCEQRRVAIGKTLELRRAEEPHVSIVESLQNTFFELKFFSLAPSIRFDKVRYISTCLNELDDMGVYIPSSDRDDWDSYCEQLTFDGGWHKEATTTDQELLRKIRALRTTQESYADDGADRADDLLLHLKPRVIPITETDRTYLKQFSEQLIIDEKNCAILSTIKNRLLDQQLPDYRPPELRNQLNDIGLSAVSRLESALEAKLVESRQGIVGVLQRYHNALAFDPKEAERAVEDYSAIVGATCQQAASKKMSHLHSSDIEFETVVIDEAARANPLDLFVPMAMAKRRIVLVGDDRQLPHLLEPELEQEISHQESLSEMQREAYKESLFERLRKQMLELEKKGGPKRVVMLDTQFRMHPLLGDFISQQFYESEGLDCIKSGRPSEDFDHAIPGYSGKVCGWLDVPINEGKEYRRNHSPHRPIEAETIAREAKRLLDQAGDDISIGIITFYGAQRDDIQNELSRLGVVENNEIVPEYRHTKEGEERIRVGTVDAFQGKEFDIVLLSIVRANNLPIPEKIEGADEAARHESALNRKYGHLRLSNRLNVAMSRQRKLLIAVGARDMVYTAEAQQAIPALFNFLKMCGGEHGCIR